MIDESDDLESLLAPRPATVSVQLHESIRRRTEGVLRRRRIVRWMGKAGIIAAIFWAGLALGWNTADPKHKPPNIVNLQQHLPLVPPKVETPPAPQLETAQAKLASLETELKLLTEQEKRETPHLEWHLKWKAGELESIHKQTKWNASCMTCHQAQLGLKAPIQQASGPIPDRIRKALDKPIKLGAKDSKISFDQVLEVFKKDAQFDVPVRNEFRITPVTSLGEELPVGAWLQLFADSNPELRLLVREYGLLVAKKELAPPDAITVSDFWKQRPERKAEAKP